MHYKSLLKHTGIAMLLYFACVGLATAIDLILIGSRNMYNTPAMSALFAGWVYLGLIQKTKHFGPITALGALMSLFFLGSGHFVLAALPNILTALVSDALAASGHYDNKGRNLLSYMIFSLGNLAPIITMWLAPKAYVAQLLAEGKSQTYVDKVMIPLTLHHALVLIGGTLLAAAISGFLWQKWAKK